MPTPNIHPKNNELMHKMPDTVHERQSKLYSHSYPDTEVVEMKDWEHVEMLYNSLITSRGRHLRVKWVEYACECMDRQALSLEDEGRMVLPILERSLKEDHPRVTDVILHYYLLALEKQSSYLYDALTPMFIEVALNRFEHMPSLLVSMACYRDNKSLEFMLSSYFNVKMEDMFASMSFEEEEGLPVGSSEGSKDEKLSKMVELIEAWQFCLPFCTPENLPSYIKIGFPTLVELLDHSVPCIRTVATSCIASVIEIQRTKALELDVDLEDASKRVHTALFAPGVTDWDEESRVAMERLVMFLDEKAYLVVVPFISLPREQRTTARKVAANTNKKGYPLTGYSEAFVLDYMHTQLKHTFSLFWDLNRLGTDGDFTDTILSILYRHPAYNRFREYIETSRAYTGRQAHFLSDAPRQRDRERNFDRRGASLPDEDE